MQHHDLRAGGAQVGSLMRHRLLLSFSLAAALLTLSSTHLLAQGSSATITAYADPAGGACTLLDNSVATFNVYIVLDTGPNEGETDCYFSLATSTGFTGTYVSAQIPYPYNGSLPDGVNIGFLTCLMGTSVIATVTYQGMGTSASCSAIEVAGHPDFSPPAIVVDTCGFVGLTASTRGPLVVNPDAQQCPGWCAVATEATTWGHVKALYR